MNEAVPDSLVEGYQDLIAGLRLPDEDDRHVLAAAIHCNASAIITFNLKDFDNLANTILRCSTLTNLCSTNSGSTRLQFLALLDDVGSG